MDPQTRGYPRNSKRKKTTMAKNETKYDPDRDLAETACDVLTFLESKGLDTDQASIACTIAAVCSTNNLREFIRIAEFIAHRRMMGEDFLPAEDE